MDAQLKKGVLELCLLQCLSGEPKYGYDVIQTMRDCFPDVTESTFYAILRRLAKEGAADTFQGSESNGPVRKYYRLTPEGRDRLAEPSGHHTEARHRIERPARADSPRRSLHHFSNSFREHTPSANMAAPLAGSTTHPGEASNHRP